MSHDNIDKVVRNYMLVFGALLVGTVLTVAASYLHLPLARRSRWRCSSLAPRARWWCSFSCT